MYPKPCICSTTADVHRPYTIGSSQGSGKLGGKSQALDGKLLVAHRTSIRLRSTIWTKEPKQKTTRLMQIGVVGPKRHAQHGLARLWQEVHWRPIPGSKRRRCWAKRRRYGNVSKSLRKVQRVCLIVEEAGGNVYPWQRNACSRCEVFQYTPAFKPCGEGARGGLAGTLA